MRILWSIIKSCLIFIALTISSQVGGLVYLLHKPLAIKIKRLHMRKGKEVSLSIFTFICMFLISSFIAVPYIAKQFGRVPLPITQVNNIKPANILTCIANRHYVTREVLDLINDISSEYNSNQKEASTILYLDANFPFLDGFPLLPHRSHDDGEKLDIAFLYNDIASGKRLHHRISFLGYGVCEEPKGNELDMPTRCKQKGHIQYSLLRKITSQRKKRQHQFDTSANRKLLKLIAKHSKTGKVFIEPHLKTRLGLSHESKIRFHGCAAVRHDDHIHVEL